MSLKPGPIQPVPEDTLRVAQAAFPKGNKHGIEVPLMNDLIEVLDLEPLLAGCDIDYVDGDFETLYSQLATEGKHPELVAERIVRYANIVGRENVMVGNDCGFGTSAWGRKVETRVAWAKLASMVEGARLASQELW